MTSGTVAMLYALLGITPSYSRPPVSNDNPYSKSQFKTVPATGRTTLCFGVFAPKHGVIEY
jgi:hypothetical protein